MEAFNQELAVKVNKYIEHLLNPHDEVLCGEPPERSRGWSAHGQRFAQ